MAQAFSVAVASTTSSAEVHVGNYYRTVRDLYHVEELHGEFALVEDCRTEIMFEVAVSEVLAMDRVIPAS